jgi:predicted kinase
MTRSEPHRADRAGPLLVIITGLPASGKTTLGRRLASELRLPFICRDDLKEILFDTLGWRDRAWSQKLGVASWELLYYLIAVELVAGRSLIVESNFRPEFDNARLQRLCRDHAAYVLQIRCVTDGDELARRYIERVASGERHPGHADGEEAWLAEVTAHLRLERHALLSLGGRTMTIDTTDFATLDVDALAAQVRRVLEGM